MDINKEFERITNKLHLREKIYQLDKVDCKNKISNGEELYDVERKLIKVDLVEMYNNLIGDVSEAVNYSVEDLERILYEYIFSICE